MSANAFSLRHSARNLLLFVSVLGLVGCSGNSEPISTDEQISKLDADLKTMFADQEPLAAPLSLPQAMARGVMYNLDHRVSAMDRMIASGNIDMEALGILPALNAGVERTHRNKDEIISANNAATGAQSLPPSIFRDRKRDEVALEASWNILDAGLSMVEAKKAGDNARIAEERRRKVVHNIMQDVREAYWRAAASQVLGDRIAKSLLDAKAAVGDLDSYANGKTTRSNDEVLHQQARLLETMNLLMSVQSQLVTAKAELAKLINLPPGQDFTLAITEADILSIPEQIVTADIKDMELVSLMIRPELRENILLSRVSAADTRAEVLGSFPGLEAAFGYRRDSNDFLTNKDWTQFSLGLAGNMMKLVSLPVRIEHMRNKEKLADMRRQASTVAVLTQVNLAKQNLTLAEDRLDILRGIMHVNHQLVPERTATQKTSMDNASQLEREMIALLARARFHMAYADYQNAYGKLLTSVGLDPLPPVYNVTDVNSLAATIDSRTAQLNPRIFSKLVTALKDKMPQGIEGSVQLANAIEPAAGNNVVPQSLREDAAPVKKRSAYNE